MNRLAVSGFLRRLIVAIFITAGVLAPQLAHAHAVLVASTPRMDETVPAGTLAIDLKFNSRVDGPHSVLSLLSPDGNEKTLPIGTQPAPNEIRTEAQSLVPGSYTIHWQALSSDGHITRGQISFKVK